MAYTGPRPVSPHDPAFLERLRQAHLDYARRERDRMLTLLPIAPRRIPMRPKPEVKEAFRAQGIHVLTRKEVQDRLRFTDQLAETAWSFQPGDTFTTHAADSVNWPNPYAEN
jgi:hypothetical protein